MLRGFYSIALAVCLAVQSVAAGPPAFTAIVSGGPATTVGDVQVVNTMAAFPKDVVETHSNNLAKLTFQGNILTLLGHSKITLLPDAAQLQGGGIVVSTATKYEVRGECFSVVPVAATAKFSVTPYAGRMYVHAEQGDLLVKKTGAASQREVRVPQGKTLAITHACKPGGRLDFASDNDTAYKIAMNGAAAAGVMTVCSLPTGKHSMSAESRVCWH